jgi:hypothetical protein
MASGNTLTIRSADPTSQISLLSAWAFNNVAGALRIRSPRLHDNVQGIRMVVDVLDSSPRYPRYEFQQPLIAQDVLTAEITGSAVGGQIETGCLLIYYANLPGIAARFISTQQLKRWGRNMCGNEVDITAGAGGNYSGQVAINSLTGTDNLKANTDYAIVGYIVNAACACVRIQGADVGNLGIGGPGLVADPNTTAYWFAWMSDFYEVPLIPVFNSANKNAMLVDVAQNQAAAAVKVTFYMVELTPPSLRT